MFLLCQLMDWNHLPVAGGIYDQDPELISSFWTIFTEQAKVEHEKKKKEEVNKSKGWPKK